MITAEVAREIAVPYTDQVVFPETVMIDLPESVDRRFPGWAGPVLVLSVENQGVCAWGVPLGGENPEILVGGDIKNAGGWTRGTTRYCRDAAEFAATRRWDESCFSQGPLLQAQAPNSTMSRSTRYSADIRQVGRVIPSIGGSETAR
ncbi:hypothetical protein [Actinoplanes philippinensis]|uniref:hypothetical protein n=1 Tax=Actinoplanes philippinensis TaxID=35752 RepID=UPI001160AE82|nr:hypothetical protein [Actinoplanes philippinensis]